MILGVYWYYRFPEGLYDFKYFRFLNGFGGHVNNPAQLQARICVQNTGNFLSAVKILKSKYRMAYLTIKTSGNQLLIETGDYNLFDYHFQLVSEIEQLLENENATLADHEIPFHLETRYDFDADWEGIDDKNKHNFIQLVGSDFKKYNAENFSLRIDCHLSLPLKKNFINDLTEACHQENISVFYYYDYEKDDFVNLMLFFTNGRQTKEHLQIVNIHSFGNRVQSIAGKYAVKYKHKKGLESYPANGPHVQLITDEEMII
ncbi:hypothetical protein MKJ01_16005 [Chryseobacterium sp. SSA4.19]|uniref:hypothetical protein n=1 Tax=Chryseobacterium sp. SSA4.19 TaxID=2919915 RepID=UPI001F4D4A39|nr:hypothetical protein [Chryseobacterium sp. SSA4.19]MCJ8155269.1 hypothetical protein [Chryseobacterium sp. SSA4.19]